LPAGPHPLPVFAMATDTEAFDVSLSAFPVIISAQNLFLSFQNADKLRQTDQISSNRELPPVFTNLS